MQLSTTNKSSLIRRFFNFKIQIGKWPPSVRYVYRLQVHIMYILDLVPIYLLYNAYIPGILVPGRLGTLTTGWWCALMSVQSVLESTWHQRFSFSNSNWHQHGILPCLLTYRLVHIPPHVFRPNPQIFFSLSLFCLFCHRTIEFFITLGTMSKILCQAASFKTKQITCTYRLICFFVTY